MPVSRRALLASPFLAAPVPVLDVHTHFYNPGRPGGVPWPPKTDPVLYRRVMPDEFQRLTFGLGVRGTVVIEASALLEDNRWILDMAKDHPIVRGFIGHLSPGTPEFAGHLQRFGKNPLFRGIRLSESALTPGLREPAFVKDLERLAGEGMVLDAIGDTRMYDAVLALTKAVPKLPVILDHLPLDGDGESRALQELGNIPQVYAKVSGVLRKGKQAADYNEPLDRLWKVFGPERLVYASNWPVSDKIAPYSVALSVMRAYYETKPPAAAAQYFWKNGAKFYGVSLR